jgi:hypothetical protein
MYQPLFLHLWNEGVNQMSTLNNDANYWSVLISEYSSLFCQKQKEIEQHTLAAQTENQTRHRQNNTPTLRYEIPLETILEERAKAKAQADERWKQGLYILEVTLPPWHNTKDTSIWGQDKYGVELIKQVVDILYTVDHAGIIHPLLEVNTHHPIKKKEAIPTKISGELDKYFQGLTMTDYGQKLSTKFNFQSKVSMENLIAKFNKLARRRNRLYPFKLGKP